LIHATIKGNIWVNKMKVLVIYAHFNPKSFNHAILESFTKGLKDGGHTYDVVDLYDTKFDPCTKPEDLAQFAGGQMPRDVLDQQEKVTAADGLVFIFPRYDWTYPAILKGWIQRVFSYGYAYRMSEKGIEGLLHPNKALLISTTNAPQEFYEKSGLDDAYKKISNMSLRNYSGIADVNHVTFYSLSAIDEESRKKYLEKTYHLGKEF
jgi:NAD(P)H dehydrogenase (quinone)